MSATATSASPERKALAKPLGLGAGIFFGMRRDPNVWGGDSSHRVRLRRPDPGHRGAGVPLLARGLPGARRRAAVRTVGADRRLAQHAVPPAVPPGGAAGEAAAEGGVGAQDRTADRDGPRPGRAP